MNRIYRWTLEPGLLALCCLMACTVLAASSTEATRLQPERLFDWSWAGDPQVASDGRRVAFVRTDIDAAKDEYRASIWIAENGGNMRQLTRGDGLHTSPRWSPDGSLLAYLSSVPGNSEIFLVDTTTGQSWRATTAGAVGQFSWSPDGTRLAFSVASSKGSADTFAPYVTEELRIRKEGTQGFRPQTPTQIWLAPIKRGKALPARQITFGSDDASNPAWGTAGDRLFFVSTPLRAEKSHPDDSNIYSIDPALERPVPVALTDRIGPDNRPIVSPNGEWIAYLGSDIKAQRKGYEPVELYVMRTDGSERRLLTSQFEDGVGEQMLVDMPPPLTSSSSPIHWTADSRNIVFRSLERGQSHLYEVGLDTSHVRRLTQHPQGDLREFDIGATGVVAVLFATPTQPGDVYVLGGDDAANTAQWKRITSVGSSLARQRDFVEYEEVNCGKDRPRTVQGWVIRPLDDDAASRWPLVLYVHGGPSAMYGTGFSLDFQLLARAGYVVLITNPQMSLGYGEQFSKDAAYEFPAILHEDLMACVDEVSSRSYVDSRRMGIAGWSAGALATAYAIGKTERFKVAVVEGGVFDFRSWVGSNDLPDWYISRWFAGDTPWNNPELYLRRSPISYVDRVSAPVLVLHSENDYRVPLEQGLQYYTALKVLNKPARLAVFPRAVHAMGYVGRPSQRVARLRLIVDWFDQHIQAK